MGVIDSDFDSGFDSTRHQDYTLRTQPEEFLELAVRRARMINETGVVAYRCGISRGQNVRAKSTDPFALDKFGTAFFHGRFA